MRYRFTTPIGTTLLIVAAVVPRFRPGYMEICVPRQLNFVVRWCVPERKFAIEACRESDRIQCLTATLFLIKLFSLFFTFKAVLSFDTGSYFRCPRGIAFVHTLGIP